MQNDQSKSFIQIIIKGSLELMKHIFSFLYQKNTIRDGGSTALYAVYAVDMVYTTDMVYTFDTVCNVQTVLTSYTVACRPIYIVR